MSCCDCDLSRWQMIHLWLFLNPATLDGNSFSRGHKVRRVRNISTRWARGNNEAGAYITVYYINPLPSHPADSSPPSTSASQAKRFAKAMHSSLIFCSTSASINVQKIFKIVLAKAFDLKCVIPEIEGVGEPILLYVDVWEYWCPFFFFWWVRRTWGEGIFRN